MLLAWLFCTPATQAAEVLVVGDMARPYFQSFVTGINDAPAIKGGRHKVVTAAIQDPGLSHAMASVAVVITAGVDAAQLVDTLRPASPVLHALVTESFLAAHQQDGEALGRAHTALLLEQPVSRYLSLFKVAFPERRRIGVIYGPSSQKSGPELRHAALQHGYEISEVSIATEAELGAALAGLLDKVEILLAIPDPVVVNTNTAKTLIHDTYLRGIALVGYSQALAKAGAVMAIHSTPEQLGRQAGGIAQTLISGKRPVADQVYYPNGFNVAVNYQIVEALGIRLPTEEVMQQLVTAQEARQ